ncbi:hypothetical protein IMZ48_06300 [Candidatus Bathyarchaeota archaeon]|nr:hypothetical protein [Candidatus Bathyarchaeota archaeon]
MKEAGLVNVTERVVKVPLGPWAKDKRLKVWGEWFMYYALEGLEGFILRGATDVLGVGSFPRHYSAPSEVLLLTGCFPPYSGPTKRRRSTSPGYGRKSRTRGSTPTTMCKSLDATHCH